MLYALLGQMHGNRRSISASFGLLAALLGVGCYASLYAHQTLAGAHIPAAELERLKPGLTSEEVTTLLGAPLEIETQGDRTTWRYFEHAQPRWCDASGGDRPEFMLEVLVHFKEDIVDDTKITRRELGSTPDAR